VKPNIRAPINVYCRRNDQLAIDSRNAPVEYADDNFQRRTAKGERILDCEECRGECYIRDERRGKGSCCDCETDNREVLPVPAVCCINFLIKAPLRMIRSDWETYKCLLWLERQQDTNKSLRNCTGRGCVQWLKTHDQATGGVEASGA
jgi:hypothetical protein